MISGLDELVADLQVRPRPGQPRGLVVKLGPRIGPTIQVRNNYTSLIILRREYFLHVPQLRANENNCELGEFSQKWRQNFPLNDVVAFRQSRSHHVNYQGLVILKGEEKLNYYYSRSIREN